VFGNPVLVTPFTAFGDSVATQYGIVGLCALTYSLSLAADAISYGVSVNSLTNAISVLTSNSALMSTSTSLTLSAVSSVVVQDTPSQTVTFSVFVDGPCSTTTVQLSFLTLASMTHTITHAAVTQPFSLGTDSESVKYGIPSLCGPIEYSIVEAHSFVSVTSTTSAGTISVQSSLLSNIGTYTATLEAKLTNYPEVAPAQVPFTI